MIEGDALRLPWRRARGDSSVRLQRVEFRGMATAALGGKPTFGGPASAARSTSLGGRHFGGRSASGAATVLPIFAVTPIHCYRSSKVLGWGPLRQQRSWGKKVQCKPIS
jgi:hypothetical protein